MAIASLIKRIATIFLAAVAASPVWGASSSGLAIDTFLQQTVTSFVGAVAAACIGIGVIVAGFRLMGTDDVRGFLRSMVILVILAGLTVGGGPLLSKILGSGAVISAPCDVCLADR